MTAHFEYLRPEAGAFDPKAIVTACIESGASSLLLDEGALTPEFFDLSTGVAGELLHGLSLYGIAMAAVIADPRVYSESFQAFVREANRGRQIRFPPDRDAAIAWLETAATS